MLKIKDEIKLRELQNFGYKYVGNYNRGDRWLKEINIIVDGKNLGGILIQEWGEISFRFPYIKDIKYPDIEPYIQDLIKADLVDKVGGQSMRDIIFRREINKKISNYIL